MLESWECRSRTRSSTASWASRSLFFCWRSASWRGRSSGAARRRTLRSPGTVLVSWSDLLLMPGGWPQKVITECILVSDLIKCFIVAISDPLHSVEKTRTVGNCSGAPSTRVRRKEFERCGWSERFFIYIFISRDFLRTVMTYVVFGHSTASGFYPNIHVFSCTIIMLPRHIDVALVHVSGCLPTPCLGDIKRSSNDLI